MLINQLEVNVSNLKLCDSIKYIDNTNNKIKIFENNIQKLCEFNNRNNNKNKLFEHNINKLYDLYNEIKINNVKVILNQENFIENNIKTDEINIKQIVSPN